MRNAVISVACVLLALVTGIYLGGHPGTLPGPIRDAFVDEDRAVRAEIIETIEDNFYKPVDESKLDDASLKGMVDSLEDPYSHYFTPKEAKAFRESISGEFEGVGMTVEKDARGLRVLNVFAGSPAKQAGIRQAGRDPAVNGHSIAGRAATCHRPDQGPGRHVGRARGVHPGRVRHSQRPRQARADHGAGRDGQARRARTARSSASCT